MTFLNQNDKFGTEIAYSTQNWIKIFFKSKFNFSNKMNYFYILGRNGNIGKRTIKVYEHFRSLFLIF